MTFTETAELIAAKMTAIVTAEWTDSAGDVSYVHDTADRVAAAQVLLNVAHAVRDDELRAEEGRRQAAMLEQVAAMNRAGAGPGLLVPAPPPFGIVQ